MSVEYVPATVCEGCGAPDPVMELVDFGVGFYDYGGAQGFHRDEHWVTRCCEAAPVPFVDEPNDNEIPENETA